MEHQLDHDACCIHCGIDACDWPRGERLPPCPVWDKETRRANFDYWLANREPLWDDVPDPL